MEKYRGKEVGVGKWERYGEGVAFSAHLALLSPESGLERGEWEEMGSKGVFILV